VEGLPLERNDGLRVDPWWVNSVPPADSFYWVQIRVAANALGLAPTDSDIDAGTLEYRMHTLRGLTIYGAPISEPQARTRFNLTQSP
jgi:hypothetical protein